jgi:hypothetical protein
LLQSPTPIGERANFDAIFGAAMACCATRQWFAFASEPRIGLQAFKQIILPALHLVGRFEVFNAELSYALNLIA